MTMHSKEIASQNTNHTPPPTGINPLPQPEGIYRSRENTYICIGKHQFVTMGNCPSATAATCCPNSSWANGASRGLPSQLTFDYDEIDDLEFENLLNDPHGPNGAFGGGPRPSTALWNRIAALFRLRRQSVGGSLIPSGGFRVGGYQAVPTDGDQGELVPGPMPPSHHHHHHGMNNDEFLRHEEDAELMSNEQIRRITSFIHEQPRSQQPPPQASPSASSDQAVSAPTSPEHIDPNDPLAAFLSEGQTESVPAPASSITQTAVTASTRSQSPTQSEQTPKFPAARPMTTFTSFRPKKRTSASASSAASAAAAFGSSFAAPLDDGLPADDEGFGQYQTASSPRHQPVSTAVRVIDSQPQPEALSRQTSDLDGGTEQGFTTPPEVGPEPATTDHTASDPLGSSHSS